MFQAVSYEGTRSEQHTAVLGQLSALIRDEPSAIANLANVAASSQCISNRHQLGRILSV